MKKIAVCLTGLLLLVSLSFSATNKVRVTALRATLYYQPNARSQVFEIFSKGTILNLLGSGEKNGWYYVSGRSPKSRAMVSGFVLASQVELIEEAPVVAKEEGIPDLKPTAPVEAQKAEPAEPTKISKAEEPVRRQEAKPQETKEPENIRTPAKIEETAGQNAKVPAPIIIEANEEKAQIKYRKFSVHLGYNKGFASQNESISWSREIYYENATYGVGYGAKEGNSFSVSLGYRISRLVGVEIGGDFISRDLSSSYSASIPHPLLFGAPRAADGKASYKVSENSFFLNLVLSVPLSRFAVDIFAGPAYFSANTDIINGIQYAQSYPYSSITVSAQNEKVSKNVVGFNGGARLIFNFSQNLGIFVSGSYFSGTAEFKPADIPALKLSLGGFKAGVGLSFSF